MNILGEILGAQNGELLRQLSNQFGIGEGDARNAVTNLLPAVSQGMKRNMESPQNMESILAALQNGDHGRYIDDPSSLTQEESVLDGNKILGHLLGSKDASREVASQAAKSTGLDLGILKKMLPLIAGLAMGSMGKKASGMGGLSQLAGSGSASNALSGLSSFLDMDGDGSIADDVLNLAKKFLR
ncbi:MAG: DUF937 domain-containing protein [Gammaproteobacteria bacterium]|nr:DUF937 domain-containing protein [Gammaproteobacteria bacterium]